MECKGSQDSHKALDKGLKAGVTQKQNVGSTSPVPLFSSAMVGGCYVPQYSSKEPPIIKFVDPDVTDIEKLLSNVDRQKLSKEIRRIGFSKMLYAAGLWKLATAVMDGKVEPDDQQFLGQLETGELAFSGYSENELGFERQISYRSFRENGGDSEAIKNDLKIGISTELIQRIKDAISKEGRLSYDVVDELIVGSSTEAPDQTKASAWKWFSNHKPNNIGTSTKTPFGVNFFLSVSKFQ